jgi:hypothetical protein
MVSEVTLYPVARPGEFRVGLGLSLLQVQYPLPFERERRDFQ